MQDYVNKFFRCLVLGGSSFCGIFLQKDGPFKVFAAVLAAMSVKRDKVLMLTRNSGCLTIYRKYPGIAAIHVRIHQKTHCKRKNSRKRKTIIGHRRNP